MRQESHRPSQYTRGVCAARARLRVEGDVAMAGQAASADQPGGRRSTPDLTSTKLRLSKRFQKLSVYGRALASQGRWERERSARWLGATLVGRAPRQGGDRPSAQRSVSFTELT